MHGIFTQNISFQASIMNDKRFPNNIQLLLIWKGNEVAVAVEGLYTCSLRLFARV